MYKNEEVVKNVLLKDGATLIRFDNPAGVPYSAIIDRDGVEIYSSERCYEGRLVRYWNEEYWNE